MEQSTGILIGIYCIVCYVIVAWVLGAREDRLSISEVIIWLSSPIILPVLTAIALMIAIKNR